MLRKDVVAAAKKGKFHIYSAKTIDEGIEILTGKPGGELGADGNYPEGTINYLVNEKLKSLAEGLKKFGAGEEEGAPEPAEKEKRKGRKGKK
jgi:ATP-dependent Lon protease